MPEVHENGAAHGNVIPVGLDELEAHLAEAWPALATMRRGPFALRFADGYGRRSNCAVASTSAVASDTDVAEVEREFEDRSMRPRFKLVGDSVRVGHLSDVLRRRGYALTEAFGVLVRSESAAGLRVPPVPFGAAVSIRPLDPARGAAAIADVIGDASHRAELGAILGRMPGLASLAASTRDDVREGCAVSVIVDGLCSIHQLATRRSHRRQGVASALVAAIIAHAGAHRVRAIAAQVADANVVAKTMFSKAGFRRSYGYAYFERTTG